MNAITVPVPAGLQQWVETRVADGEYVDVADYLRDLMRRDRDRQMDIERMRALVEEGLASGVVDAEPEDILREMIAGIDEGRG